MKLDLDLDALLGELLARPEAVSKMVDALKNIRGQTTFIL